jgi:nuclear pore complex protein Nup62
MEDILNLWTKELEKQTKDFHKQANQVAKWDQQLIENGNKISTLHENVTKVEVTQREIDQNLEYINSQQEELNAILDTYEKQIKQVFEENNLQQPMQPADLQREKAYGLAESLNSQLDDVNKNLNIMVEEINKMANGANARQVSTGDDEDVVGQIVQILNSHLSSLQWIDENSMKLQSKIQEVGKLQSEVVRDQDHMRR